MLNFETPGGSHPPPPLPGRVMENALPGRGLRNKEMGAFIKYHIPVLYLIEREKTLKITKVLGKNDIYKM